MDSILDESQLPGHLQHCPGGCFVGNVHHVTLVSDGGSSLVPLLLHGLDQPLPLSYFFSGGGEYLVDHRNVLRMYQVHAGVAQAHGLAGGGP